MTKLEQAQEKLIDTLDTMLGMLGGHEYWNLKTRKDYEFLNQLREELEKEIKDLKCGIVDQLENDPDNEPLFGTHIREAIRACSDLVQPKKKND